MRQQLSGWQGERRHPPNCRRHREKVWRVILAEPNLVRSPAESQLPWRAARVTIQFHGSDDNKILHLGIRVRLSTPVGSGLTIAAGKLSRRSAKLTQDHQGEHRRDFDSGFIARRAGTSVEVQDRSELRDGRSSPETHSKRPRADPWLSQLPVIGALFSLSAFQGRISSSSSHRAWLGQGKARAAVAHATRRQAEQWRFFSGTLRVNNDMQKRPLRQE